jgi:hypothetical protein
MINAMSTTPVNYKQITRGYSAIRKIMYGGTNEYMSQSILMPDHLLSKGFTKLEHNTVKSLFDEYDAYKEVIAKFTVDGIQIVGLDSFSGVACVIRSHEG